MEALSGASSVLAVVSLAIQIADSVKKLSEFWSSIKNAPQSIQTITRDLELVSSAFEDIGTGPQNDRSHSKDLTLCLDILQSCEQNVKRLCDLTDDLKLGLESKSRGTRLWSGVKATWREEMIRGIQETLRDLKITLILARQTFTRSFFPQEDFEFLKLMSSMSVAAVLSTPRFLVSLI